MLPNISSFDLPELAADVDRVAQSTEGFICPVEIGLSAGLPTLFLILAITIILKQNLDRVLAILTRLQILFRAMVDALRRLRHEEAAAPPIPMRQTDPLNECDSDRVERGEGLPREVWM